MIWCSSQRWPNASSRASFSGSYFSSFLSARILRFLIVVNSGDCSSAWKVILTHFWGGVGVGKGMNFAHTFDPTNKELSNRKTEWAGDIHVIVQARSPRGRHIYNQERIPNARAVAGISTVLFGRFCNIMCTKKIRIKESSVLLSVLNDSHHQIKMHRDQLATGCLKNDHHVRPVATARGTDASWSHIWTRV